jgi:hypothetical protein
MAALLVPLFGVPFVAAGLGAYNYRTNQLASAPTEAVAVVDTTIASETTVPETTVPLAVDTAETIPVETDPPTTVKVTVPPTTAPPDTTPVVPAAPVSTSGAFLHGIDTGDRAQFDPAVGCGSLVRPGATLRGCNIGSSGGANVAWVSMNEGVDILISPPDQPDIWNVVLRSESAPSREPLFTDVTGDGESDFVVGWRGDDRTLNIDVVEVSGGTPQVTLHLTLADGRVSGGDGRLDVWKKLAGSDNAYANWSYTGGGGAWETSKRLETDPPGGQL